jgi:SAM-dependent methyltransferase
MSTLQTTSQSRRGERLHPPRTSRLFAVLTKLRRVMEQIVARDLPTERQLEAIDLGCGNMPYRPLFESRGVHYRGADLPGNPDAQLTLDPATGRVDVPDGSCDIVVSTQVLEHVASPAAYLAECRRLLRPGGRLILSTHGYWWYHPDPQDFWRWTGDGLRRLITEQGFTVERTVGVLGLSAAGLQLFQDGRWRAMPRFMRPLFALVMQTLILVFDRLHTEEQRAKDAAVYVIVATRG